MNIQPLGSAPPPASIKHHQPSHLCKPLILLPAQEAPSPCLSVEAGIWVHRHPDSDLQEGTRPGGFHASFSFNPPSNPAQQGVVQAVTRAQIA